MLSKLKEIRIKNNYSFQKMADILGISKTFYWQIESGHRCLRYSMALRIANIFKMKPDDIFLEDFINIENNKEVN